MKVLRMLVIVDGTWAITFVYEMGEKNLGKKKKNAFIPVGWLKFWIA